MRASDISERSFIRGNVVQEKPCLERRMKRIGMKRFLRINRAAFAMRNNRLHIMQWFDPETGHVVK